MENNEIIEIWVKTCPKCGDMHEHSIEIKTGTFGLFSYPSFSHYKCANCNFEYKNYKYETAYRREPLTRLHNQLRKKYPKETKIIRDFFKKAKIIIW